MTKQRHPELTTEQIRVIIAAGKNAAPGPLARDLGLEYWQVKYCQFKLGLRERSCWGEITPAQAERVKEWAKELELAKAYLPDEE